MKARKKRTPSAARPAPAALSEVQRRPAWQLTLAAIVLAGATFLVYLPSLDHGFLQWDDGDYVRNNYHVHHLSRQTVKWAFGSRHAANWHPLTWLSHALDVKLFGLDRPQGHHWTNVLLHALNAALVFLVLWRLLRRFWPCLVVAVVFALHPLRVEVVSWVAERKELLCSTFFLLTLLTYTWYVARPSAWRYLLVALAFAAALASKPMAVTLPFLLLLLDFWPLKRLSWTRVLEKAPLLAMSVASSVATVWAQGAAKMKVEYLSIPSRVANAAISYAAYLGKLFWPAPGTLLPFYTLYRDLPGGLPIGLVVASCLILVAISALAIWQWRRRPYLVTGWLWYLGMMVPVIGIVQVGMQRMADRYTYLPLIGVVLAVVLLLDEVVRAARLRKALLGAAGPVLATLGWLTMGQTLGWLTIEQQKVWADVKLIWQHVLKAEPGSSVARQHLLNAEGLELFQSGQLEQALANYQQALALNAENQEALNNVGIILTLSDRPREAEPYLRKAVRLYSYDAAAHCNLGFALSKLPGKADEAADQFAEAVALDPNLVSAYAAWARLEMNRKRYAEAVPLWEKVVELAPGAAVERASLGTALLLVGRREEAIRRFQEALRLQPDLPQARRHLDALLQERGRGESATGP